jgi:hypothetical protein
VHVGSAFVELDVFDHDLPEVVARPRIVER